MAIHRIRYYIQWGLVARPEQGSYSLASHLRQLQYVRQEQGFSLDRVALTRVGTDRALHRGYPASR